MRVICHILLFSLLSLTGFAQNQPGPKNSGEWNFVRYSDKIIKIIYTPADYKTNENISDAVIAKKAPPREDILVTKVNGKNILHPEEVLINASGHGIISPANNLFELLEPFQKDGYHGFKFKLAKGTKVFGGGERALPLNRRGYRFNFYNNPWYGYAEGADNLNYSVPFLTTSDGYGLFFDNPSKGYADIGKSDSSTMEVGFSSGEINVYVIFGNDYKQILSGYNRLTGTQPLPPRWAFGNLMSRFGYTSQAQATDILAKMKSENIPVDAIIFDLFWFGDSIKGTMGNLDWVNKTKWPDPKKMISDFKKQNVQTILITEPFVVKSSSNYENSKNYLAVDSAGKPYTIGDFYFGAGGLIDIFRKDAQDWFWSKHKPQMNNGVEAWWGDLGEPEKHPADLYHNLKDLGFTKRLFKADEVHNLYGHTWTKMLYEKYAKEYPNKRLFSLNRSGFAGTQRYGIFPWSGDVSRGWSGLRAQLPIMLGMSISGIPYAHADAGGFAGGEGDNELYVRWLQFAAFTPIFRPHGTALYEVDKAAFSFPSEAALIEEPYRSYAKKAIALRYTLLPYNYTLAYKQAKSGAPLVSPLFYNYPKDTIAARVADQFMWGENILVAPVLNKNEKARTVYLPKGNWYDFSTNEISTGIKTDSSDIHEIPVYVKEGSFIFLWLPIGTSLTSTANFTGKDDVTAIYYPSAIPDTSILFMDDGATKNAPGETISFNGVVKNGRAKIEIRTSNIGLYKNGFTRKFRLRVPGDFAYDSFAVVNGRKTGMGDVTKNAYPFNKGIGIVYTGISVEFTGKPVTIEFELNK